MGPDKYLKNYIGGKLTPADSGDYLDDINPATGKVYAHLPDSGDKDLQRAAEAAERAWPGWSSCGLRKRFRLLVRIADIIEQNLEVFARAETIDTGKPLSMSRSMDIPRAQANFRFFASAILHFSSESQYVEREAVHQTLRQPLGIVGCASSPNLPLYLLSWKIAPALAMGNCVIATPSELSPMTAYLLSQACMEAGLPPGVLNIVHGKQKSLVVPLAGHPKIRALSYTGDHSTGQQIFQASDGNMKKLSLELGGKNPNIIFADCDFDQMIVGALRSSFSNNGQISHCASRIYVERPLYDRFKEEFVKRTQFLKVGDPFSSVSDLGALLSREHLEKVERYLQLAEVEGGRLLCGGKRVAMQGEYEHGYFIRPAVIEGLSAAARVNQEEIFGPVVTIAPFDTVAEAVQLANNTIYGLSASIWTQDISRAYRVAESLQTGMVWVNNWLDMDLRAPQGGTKQSGLNREGGSEALRFFSNTKNIRVRF